MTEEAECEIARPGNRQATERDRRAAAGGPERAVLRTADGVRIEAAHTPCASPGDAPGDRVLVLAHGFSGSLGRPAVRRAAQAFARHSGVVTFSFRGHGGSGGHSTVGDREVEDLAAVVRWARSLGYRHVTTVGFSMGGSVVVRHGALYRAPDDGTDEEAHGERTSARGGAQPAAHTDAVVAVSAPARWYYRGTAPMRRLHWVVLNPAGRLVSRYGLRTRIHPRDWDPVPLSPVQAAPLLAPVPLLVVHGDADPYFPLDHPRALAAAAGEDGAELWIEPGYGHAENAAGLPLLDRIAAWARGR